MKVPEFLQQEREALAQGEREARAAAKDAYLAGVAVFRSSAAPSSSIGWARTCCTTFSQPSSGGCPATTRCMTGWA